VLDQEQQDPRPEQEEDELGDGVRRRRGPGRVQDRGRDQQHQRPRDGQAAVDPGPDGVDDVRREDAEEQVHVEVGHRPVIYRTL
jgi:hypothetical protein